MIKDLMRWELKVVVKYVRGPETSDVRWHVNQPLRKSRKILLFLVT